MNLITYNFCRTYNQLLSLARTTLLIANYHAFLHQLHSRLFFGVDYENFFQILSHRLARKVAGADRRARNKRWRQRSGSAPESLHRTSSPFFRPIHH